MKEKIPPQPYSFNPIGVTFETIDKLAKLQETDAIALYMAYSAVSHWQKTYKPKATKNFMMKRLGWSEQKFSKAKKVLKDLFLIADERVTGKDGKVVGWYIKINHLASKPHTNKTTPLEMRGGGKTTPQVHSTINKSAFNYQKGGDFKKSHRLSYEELDKSEATYKTKKKIYEQKGITYKPSRATKKQERAVAVLKLVDYFREQAYDLQSLEYFTHPKDKNPRIIKQASDFLERCDDDKEKAKEIIKWFLDEYGEWCQYEPEQCFTSRTVRRFENNDKTKVKVHYL